MKRLEVVLEALCSLPALLSVLIKHGKDQG